MCAPAPVRARPNVYVRMTSANVTLGPLVAVTMVSSDSCPPNCPYRGTRGNGLGTKGHTGPCYAETSKMVFGWKKVDSGEYGTTWEKALMYIERFPADTLGRWGDAGDCPGADGFLDATAMDELTHAMRGQQWWGFTHYTVTERAGQALTRKAFHNAIVIKKAIKRGFALNISCDSLAEADRARAMGFPVAVVVPSDTRATVTTPNGLKVAMCPHKMNPDRVTCGGSATTRACGSTDSDGRPWCLRSDRKFGIGFPAHGIQKRKVDARLALFAQEATKKAERIAGGW